jgi:NAD(P)-dependent dehydrogenase (short-subunit alcohol dehydrogenase family)
MQTLPTLSSERIHTIGGTVVVTGAASGLGAAVVRAVRKAGFRAIGFDLRKSDEEGESLVVDVSRRADVEQALHDLVQRYGELNAVVTCAGIDACGKLTDVNADDWERVITVNLLGTVALVRAALPHLENSGGRVITVASTLGLRALSDATAYCASKFGVVGFTRALAVEMAGRVGVTLLIPGGMHTHFFDGREEKYKPPADAQLNSPDEVAEAVVFALTRPRGCEVREMVVCPSMESSWPP